MHGLKQIEVITQGDGWHLVGLDAEGHLWFGSPRRTAKGRGLNWALMDESLESEGPSTSTGGRPETVEPPAEGLPRRPWPTKPSS